MAKSIVAVLYTLTVRMCIIVKNIDHNIGNKIHQFLCGSLSVLYRFLYCLDVLYLCKV